MHEHFKRGREQNFTEMRKGIKEMFHVEDTTGLEVLRLIRGITHLTEAMAFGKQDDIDLSGPRWRLMLSLLIAEKRGFPEGMTPTMISEFQRVSKNTISALLRGLEEQGLIQRNLDPKDFRVFRIQLTQAGRDLMTELAPKRLNDLNEMLSDLSHEEREQLVFLLEKLQHSLMNTCAAKDINCDRKNEGEHIGED